MGNFVKGKIIIFPTRIIIEPYIERNAHIESSFSVWNDVTHKYDFQAFIKDEENHKLIIPTYSIQELRRFYPGYEVVNKIQECENIISKLKSNKKIKLKFDFKNELQKKAYSFLNKKDNIKANYKFTQRFLCLSTGFGKTYLGCRYIVENNERPIIFVDKEGLGLQWTDRIKYYTDTTDEEIYYISGMPSVNKLMKMTDEEIQNIKFFICCYRTLTNSIKNNNGSEVISNLFNKLKITLKIFDEAHVEYSSIFKIDMISNVNSIYMTATPKRSTANEDKVYQKMFEKVFKITESLFEDKPENYHNIIIYKWSTNPSISDQAHCEVKYGFSMARYCSYLENIKYDEFKDYIINILFNTVLANRKKKKTAILFGTLSLLDKFYDSITKYINDNNFKLTVNKFNGNTKKEDKLKLLDETDIILTTDKSFEKGMDVKNLQVLINTVPFSSDSKLIQVVGRLRKIPNKEVIFIDVNDIGFKAIKYQLYNKYNKVYNNLAKNLFVKE